MYDNVSLHTRLANSSLRFQRIATRITDVHPAIRRDRDRAIPGSNPIRDATLAIYVS